MHKPKGHIFPGFSIRIIQEELIIKFLNTKQMQNPIRQFLIFLYSFCNSFHDKFIQSLVFLSDGDGQVEYNGIFQHFHLGIFVKFLCFSQHA